MKTPLIALLAGLALVGCQTPETTPTKSAPVAAPAKVVPAQRNLAVGPTPESVTKGFGGKYFVTLMGASRKAGDGDGKVVKVESGEEVVIEIAPNTQVRIVTSTIADVRSKGEPVKEAAKEPLASKKPANDAE